ncbi:thermonuclease family protein [Roseomonas vastitatis]|uniref:Thermonuclease family protein n=1 Tax=Teichococcus vastitatis TaxID=2307076 RepID=A0ABS9W823_9PROT|nr:thermonuclease family protein [Pseudoroseomonas vastitatis]MCI0755446.1 thermonuclease family protein [Pseudoroseomonas vastitatis]
MPVLRLLLVPALLLLFSFPALPAELRGEVVGISDGDTLTLLTATRQQVRVRLAEIGAPESRQPWDSRAQQALSALVFRKAVLVAVQNTDRYGRTVGTVWVGRLNANAEMIRQGHAWVYRQDPSRSLAAGPGGRGSAGPARAVGAAGGGTGAALGLAPAGAHRRAACPLLHATSLSGLRNQWLQLRRQAPVPRDEQLRRSALSPAATWAEPAGWGSGRRALREPRAEMLVLRHQAVVPEALHAWWRDLLPAVSTAVLDVAPAAALFSAYLSIWGSHSDSCGRYVISMMSISSTK